DSGSEVALSQVGNIMAISSPSSNANGLHSGLVRIFEYLGGVWTQIGEDINGEASEDYFGWSIALSASGNVIAIGALWNDDNGFNSGHVKIYQNIGGEWTQIGENINGEAASDESGFSVDISDDGSTVAIGAKANDGNGDFSGHVRVFDLSSIILSLPGYDLQNNISIFPIPSDESISINGIGDDILAQFSIFDSRGKLIRSEAETIGSIDISDLSMGIYYLRIESSSSTIVLKFIKE
ncbi:MAG: T9SS type A sorting domain-containing protein, partial [Flavobacteriales bacterium]|nr:T9SS type A sorting domain-containing protein [Flavobacteriales bacterium]